MNFLLLLFPFLSDTTAPVVQIVFTSDIHYGITRPAFDGDSNVTSNIVDARLVRKINRLPSMLLPNDLGLAAGQPIGAVDYIMISGDICNRQETAYQSATASWTQFTNSFLHGINVKDHQGNTAGFLLVAGNHDVSDAIGYYRKMTPATDPASLVGIYNYMLNPPVPITSATFRYPEDKINYSRNIGGIHFLFVNIWPDSANRIWMEKDLSGINPATPVVIVCHDPPDGDAAHFRNPNGKADINDKDRFECLLEETSKDIQDPGSKGDGKPQNDSIEQKGFVSFLKKHPNVKAYFHGHNNWNEFYTYTGLTGDIHLPAFRVDSPMKGKLSSRDETKLSFQLISIDPTAKTLTVRECLWNPNPANPDADPVWGDSFTLAL
ncbi:MAG TPA: metallophosphoesterase [Puia sp.]|jgi:hypothetical protein|nr:metallophosphoesterase [Puia sp.]